MRHWKWIPWIAFAASLQCVARCTGAESLWVDSRQVGVFTIQATFPLAGYEPLFQELPQLQSELSHTLSIPPARNPIYVYLFASEEQYKEYVELYFPKVPYRQALFIWEGGAPGVYTYRKSGLAVDLRHECTHALLHSVLPAVPLWLDEGLAKYFEVPANQRASHHPYFNDLRWKWSLRLGMVRTVQSLEERETLSELDSADYRYSWAWVHFMLHGPEPARAQLVDYISCYQQSAPPGKLSQRLAQAVSDPTEQMISHFKHWR